MKSPTASILRPVLAMAGVACAVGVAAFYAGRASVASNTASAATGNVSAAPARGSFVVMEAAKSRSLEDFLQAAKPEASDLAEWAKGLRAEDRAAVMAQLAALPAGAQRDAIMGAVINAWAADDPGGFLAASDGIPTPRLREDGVDAAMRAWAAQDPKAALAWLKDNAGGASTNAARDRYTAAIAGFASTDPQGALDTVATLGEGSARDIILKNNSLQTIIATLAQQGNFGDAAKALGQLPNGQMQTMATVSLAQQWAQVSPQDAATWLAGITDPSLREQAGTEVVETWALSDPAGAAAWAAQQEQQATPSSVTGAVEAPVGPGQLLASAIRSWAAYDLDAPGKFLNQLPASPSKDDAIAIFATRAGQEDPQSALQWVGTISDPDIRQRATMVTAFQLAQSDPAAFAQFISTTTALTDDQKQMLQNVPQNLSTRLGFMMAAGGAAGPITPGGGTGGGVFQRGLDNAITAGPSTPGASGNTTVGPAVVQVGNAQPANAPDTAAPDTAAPGDAPPPTETPGDDVAPGGVMINGVRVYTH